MGDISKITIIDGTDFDIKDAFSRERLSWYGTCSTSADATTKVVTCNNFTLATGRTIAVKFDNTNTGAVASLKLNVNQTGAKAIKYKGADIPSAGLIASGSVIHFAYDGTNYEIIGGIGAGTGGVTSVNNKTGAVTLNASDVGAVASSQGSGNAGAFLVVNSSGIVEPVQMTAWAGGEY